MLKFLFIARLSLFAREIVDNSKNMFHVVYIHAFFIIVLLPNHVLFRLVFWTITCMSWITIVLLPFWLVLIFVVIFTRCMLCRQPMFILTFHIASSNHQDVQVSDSLFCTISHFERCVLLFVKLTISDWNEWQSIPWLWSIYLTKTKKNTHWHSNARPLNN